MQDSPDMVQVLITVPFSADQLAAFREISPLVEILYHPAEMPDDVPNDAWAKAAVLYTSHVIPDPAQVPNLRWLHVHSAGVDHVLEQPLGKLDDVQITTSSGIHATIITEYVFMMMLAFGHRLLALLKHQSTAHWPDENKYTLFMPLELRGSTIGIVGYGSIGREIARLANTFGMEVLAIKRNVFEPSDLDGYALPGTGDAEGQFFHRLYPPEALVTMVRDCDFVVITTPLTEATRLMFGKEAFEAMKPTAYLINVGRGGVLDEQALLHALQQGKIAGAALDVFEAEPLPDDSPLWKQPNVIISPHISGNSPRYNERAAALFGENLRRFLGHKDLLNRASAERGY